MTPPETPRFAQVPSLRLECCSMELLDTINQYLNTQLVTADSERSAIEKVISQVDETRAMVQSIAFQSSPVLVTFLPPDR